MAMVRGPLRSRNFRLLLACDVISVTGSAVAAVAIPFAVLDIGGSASDVGYVAAASLVPVIVFLLLGGVVADRLPRHQVMMAANALQALAQGASAALMLTGHARVGELAADAASFAVAGALRAGMRFPARPSAPRAGLLPEMRAGCRDFISRRWLWAIVAAAALAAGACLEVFGVNWATTMQQEIPPAMLSRVSAYDVLGSIALAPVGTAVAGPAAHAFGAPAVLATGGVLIVLLTAAVLFVPEVRHLRRQPRAPTVPPGTLTP